MTVLKLELENVDREGSECDDIWQKRAEAQKSPIQWVKSINPKERRRVRLSGYRGTADFKPSTLATVLRDFLEQPDSKASLVETQRSILALIPPDAHRSQEMSLFCDFCIELAYQIPYHHPSHMKFAYLLELLATSTTFTEWDGAKCYVKFQRLTEEIADAMSGPFEEAPMEYVNFQAFVASLRVVGLTRTSHPAIALHAMRDAFENGEYEHSWEADSFTMAAAQWILIGGQGFFFQLTCPVDFSNPRRQWDDWQFGKHFPGSEKMLPRSLDRWRFWKQGFEAVANGGKASEECVDVAKRAARIMEALDDNMKCQ